MPGLAPRRAVKAAGDCDSCAAQGRTDAGMLAGAGRTAKAGTARSERQRRPGRHAWRQRGRREAGQADRTSSHLAKEGILYCPAFGCLVRSCSRSGAPAGCTPYLCYRPEGCSWQACARLGQAASAGRAAWQLKQGAQHCQAAGCHGGSVACRACKGEAAARTARPCQQLLSCGWGLQLSLPPGLPERCLPSERPACTA